MTEKPKRRDRFATAALSCGALLVLLLLVLVALPYRGVQAGPFTSGRVGSGIGVYYRKLPHGFSSQSLALDLGGTRKHRLFSLRAGRSFWALGWPER